jgi:hypothetical protein
MPDGIGSGHEPCSPPAQRGRIGGRLRRQEGLMLTTILVLLLVLWFLGLVSSYTLGGFIHILLVIAVALVLIRIIQGRNPV